MSEGEPQEEKGEPGISDETVEILECREQPFQKDENGLACQSCWKTGKINHDVSILCFDCEKYLCAECGQSYAGDHGEHLRTGAVYNSKEPDDMRQNQLSHIYQIFEAEANDPNFLEDQSDFSELPINVKMTDEDYCSITGISILPNRQLAVVDEENENRSLKIIDMNENKIKLFKFSDIPFGVAFLTEGNVAVTFQDKQLIMILNINDDEKQLTTRVQVKDKCTGIHCHDGKLFAIGKKTMYILQGGGDLESIHLNQLNFKSNEKSYIAVRSDDDIFIVGNACNFIYRTAINGDQLDLKRKYELNQSYISGIFLMTGHFILLSTRNGILKLDQDSEDKTLLSDVRRPQALAESRGIVFVSHKAGPEHRNFITTFQIQAIH